METKQMPPYPLRMPSELREALEANASSQGRSLNAEIVSRLEDSLRGDLQIDLIEANARLEAVRDSFALVVAESTRQISEISALNKVTALALNAALEDFDSLADMTHELLQGKRPSSDQVQEKIQRLLRSREVISREMDKINMPNFPSLAEVIRENNTKESAEKIARDVVEKVHSKKGKTDS